MPAHIAVLTLLALKATIVVGCAGLAALALARASAAVRHLVWLAALCCLLLLPLAVPLAPRWNSAPRSPQRAPMAAAARTVVEVTASSTNFRPTARTTLWALWAAGALLLTGRVLLGHWRAARLAARSTAWGRQAGHPVRISAELDVPVVCGLTSPVIVLPAAAAQWDAERLDLVLRHEAMHAERRDLPAQFIAELATALYWPLPWVWLAAARLRAEAERACDDGVLCSGRLASSYAGHLIDIVRNLTGRERIPEGGIPMARISELEHRLRAMLKPNLNRQPAGRLALATAAVAALALLVPLSAVPMPALALDGTLTGVVKDVSGAVVPDARVTISFIGSARREVTRTDQIGQFAIGPLPDGEYSVSIAKPGFALLTTSGIAMENGLARKLDLVLQPGKIVESMTVTAESAPPAPVAVNPGEPKRLRVGGNMQQAKMLKNVRPTYPPACKAERIQGTVLLTAVISKEGDILSLEPINKLVDPRLVDSATEAVKNWKYQPTLLNGEPVEIITTIEVNYTLLP